MKRILALLLLIIVAIFFTAGGYRLIESSIARLTFDFNVLPSDNRIVYENGAEALAEAAARYLPQAIPTVESKQYGTFKGQVKIYAFSTSKHFSKFSGVPEEVIGAGLKNEVYLSGKLLDKTDKIQGILTHELSHAQLSQTLGVIKFNQSLPRWFREGLAIYVANGGGATNASEAETIEKFLEGKYFIPETEGGLFNIKLAATEKLEPKIFYRQSGMFVQFLARSNPAQFEELLRGLQKGNAFAAQFISSFKKSTDEELKDFISTLKRT
jgi:hypothetical protein